MRRIGLTMWIALLAAAGAGKASAQAPDIRDVRPVVMLLVDTSGSMEYEAGQPSGTLPTCTGAVGTSERSRWATVLEALTGSWPAFSCTAVSRTVFVGAPDQYYRLPYHQPPNSGQLDDGILDTYRDRVKFGLMTYDNVFGLRSIDPVMVPQSVFMARLAANAGSDGDYSYGVPRPLTFPGCGTTYMVDGGARHASAPEGALISVGNDATDPRLINAMIQTQLLTRRPYGATPTAALLDDFRYYLQNHPDVAPPSAGGGGDPLAACRPRYAILLTDGQPNDPYRDAMGCGAAGFQCPYDRPANIAADLCRYSGASGECTGLIDGLFVVGFDVGDASAQALLDDIADRGGTRRAMLATDRASLMAALSAALDVAAPGTTTRTNPAFGLSSTSVSSSGTNMAFQFNSGFQVSSPSRPGPWRGVLDRTRVTCSGTTPVTQRLDPTVDSFHEILNRRDVNAQPRRLLTVATPRPNEMTGVILGTGMSLAPIGAGGGGGGGGGGGVTRVTGESLEPFDVTNGALTPAHFGITGSSSAATALRNYVINWVHGRPGTPRDGDRFGDIYHSSPVVVGPPRSDIADESYNLFRRRPEVANRPTVVYVGTNDGILHCFAAEDFRAADGSMIRGGTELWGFVPPAVVPRLLSATSSHQILVDGTPVVRDVFYQRLPGAQPTADPRSPAAYRTVLVMGLRGGGNAYFALDVTNPLQPEFLWQFTDRYMGQTYARPAIGQVLVTVGGQLQERAVALLPGGQGDIDVDAARTTGPVGCPAQGIGQPPPTDGVLNARSRQRCWGRVGRDLHWVDIVTGETLFSFDSRTFNAPMTGGVSLFVGDTGTIATRAFLTDEDGVIWRVDFSSPNPSQWTALPFHDVFWDGGATTGQPSYEPPVLTTDTEGNVVVVVATGNVDQLDGTAQNRVVSLTERLTGDIRRPATASLNWELRLRAGEQVTGPLELYNGTLYFGSFESSSSTDACSWGQSRIWGVEYRRSGGRAPPGYLDPLARFPLPRMESVEGSGTFDAHFVGPFVNQIVMGVQVSQQLTCVNATTLPDPYIGPRAQILGTGGGAFQLVAQVSGQGTGSTAGASSVRTITRTLPAPNAYTRTFSWTPQADR